MRRAGRLAAGYGALLATLLALSATPAAAEPECTLAVHPRAVREGQSATLRWTAANAATIRLERIGAFPAGGSGEERVSPTETTTYVAEAVDGSGATARCSVSVAVVPDRIPFAAWPPDYLRGLPEDYLERVRASLEDGLRRPRLDRDIGWVLYATQALAVGHDEDAINRYFADDFAFPEHRKIGFGLHAVDTLRFYGLYHDGSRQMPGRLDDAAQRRILDEIWFVASHWCRLDVALAGATWTMDSSENHDIAAKSGCLLATQWLAIDPDYADRPFDDGSDPREQYPAWRDFMSAYIDERARRGLFAEIASPSYEDEAIQALLNVRDFADDAALATKAEMLVDLLLAVAAQDSLGGVRGGGKSRVYTFRPEFWGTRDRGFDLLFGTPPSVPFRPLQFPAFSTSSYYPPAVVVDLARDEAGRGRYATVERRPGVLVPGADRRGPIDPTRSVLRYSWVTPSSVLGTIMLDPDAAYAPFSSQNRWQGIVFAGDAEDRIGTQLTRLRPDGSVDREQRTHNAFFSLQHENVLLTRKLGNPGVRVQVYFSETLDELEERNGWIFVREGGAFAAVGVVDGGYRWIDPDRRNLAAEPEERFIVLDREDSPLVLVTGEAADFGDDLAGFEAFVTAQPVEYRDGTLQYADLTLYPPPTLGRVGSTTVDLTPERAIDSPFIRSVFGSGYVEIGKGARELVLDFRDPNHPRKTAAER